MVIPLNQLHYVGGGGGRVYAAVYETGTPSMWVTVFPSFSAKTFLSAQSASSLIWKLCLIPVEMWKTFKKKMREKKKKKREKRNILVLGMKD